MNKDTINKLKFLHLSKEKAEETLKNATLTSILMKIHARVCKKKINPSQGNLLYHLATKIKPQIFDHLDKITDMIVVKELDTTYRVEKAIEFFFSSVKGYCDEDLKNYCGVGIVVTPEEIEAAVEKVVNENREEIVSQRYRYNTGLLMIKVRQIHPWADGKAVKNEIDVHMLCILGPKTEDDLLKQKEKLKAQAEAKKVSINNVMKKLNFHKPGENYKTDGYIVTRKTHELLKKHLEATGGRVRTRFPPEPNGILHIGHAKAININFGYAKAHGGSCFLRYDDTNPEKEEERFFVGIKDMVSWLGYEPEKVTHSSDYFDQLYEWAVILIKADHAYVCHQTADQMKGFNPEPSPWRDRPIAESLRLFEDMKNGKIDENAATLRMKITLEEGKLDPVAYRVRFIPHHRTGDKWCIYPTYDYTHCLCDSIENITHSLCTKEFQSRRSSYYWLCNALNVYCPVQWEYGRLNVNYTVVSKRKIAKLIETAVVKDWDDPRLYTLTALRRRGFPPEAINTFCAHLGVTGAQSTVDPSMLEAFVREYLNEHAPRQMVVLNPLKITIENLSENRDVEVPLFPSNPELGNRTARLHKIIYIERDDFMEMGNKGFRRLTKDQSVGLRYTGLVLTVSKINEDGIICQCEDVTKTAKPKAFIHWVSDPMTIDVNLYELLFKHKNPEDPDEVPGGFLSDCNPESHRIIKAYADRSIKNAKVYDKFQFERVGFFSVDPDSCDEKLVFNQTVNLKESSSKQ